MSKLAKAMLWLVALAFAGLVGFALYSNRKLQDAYVTPPEDLFDGNEGAGTQEFGDGLTDIERSLQTIDLRAQEVGFYEQKRIIDSGFVQFIAPARKHTRNSVAACMYLKTMVEAAKQSKIFDLVVVQEALAAEDAGALNILKQVVEFSGGAVGAAASVGVGAAGAMSALAGGVSSAIGLAILMGGLTGEEEKRWGQALAVNKFFQKYIEMVGLPPTSLLHAQARYLGVPDWSPIDGQGGFLRTKEPAVAQFVWFMRLYAKLQRDGWINDNIPFINLKQWKHARNRGAFKVVMDNDLSEFHVSRFADWTTRFGLNFGFMLSEPRVPRTWPNIQNPAADDPYLYYERVLTNDPNPFVFSVGSCVEWLRQAGVFMRMDNVRGVPVIVPTRSIFHIGYDPGARKVPTPLLGLLGGGGTVTFAKKSWQGNITIPFDVGQWFIVTR